MEEGGFEPPKSSTTDLQSAPFGHSGTPPYLIGAGGRTRTPDLLITNQLLYQLSYTSESRVSFTTMLTIPDVSRNVNTFFEKMQKIFPRPYFYPFRDIQQDGPVFFCAHCGQEQYWYDPPAEDGLCPICREKEQEGEEDAMTLKEMAPLCRQQAKTLRSHIRDLRQEKNQAQTQEERDEVEARIQALYPMVREMEELAEHMEHYYDGGYGRNEKYTI